VDFIAFPSRLFAKPMVDRSDKERHRQREPLFKMFRLLWVFPILYASEVVGLACPAPMRLKLLLQAEIDGTRDSDKPIMMPCCYDGLTARLITRAGFDATFMTGFGVSGT
jgi:hypothetical protein